MLTSVTSGNRDFQKCDRCDGSVPYSIFDNASLVSSLPLIQQSQHSFHESDSGSNSDDSATNRIKRKRYCNLQGRCEEHTKEDGGAMALPLQQQHSHQTVWTSVLEDQNLSSDMSRVNMDKMLDGDRTVESYDYTRAADDQRPDLLPKDGVCGETENELFSEVIDMDKVISRHKCNLKRKYGHMTSTDLSRCDRLQLPAVLNRVSNEEVTYYISSSLQEKKVHLISKYMLSYTIRLAVFCILSITTAMYSGWCSH